jgi:hypothetical protein
VLRFEEQSTKIAVVVCAMMAGGPAAYASSFATDRIHILIVEENQKGQGDAGRKIEIVFTSKGASKSSVSIKNKDNASLSVMPTIRGDISTFQLPAGRWTLSFKEKLDHGEVSFPDGTTYLFTPGHIELLKRGNPEEKFNYAYIVVNKSLSKAKKDCLMVLYNPLGDDGADEPSVD